MTVTSIKPKDIEVPDFVAMTGPDKPMAELAVALVAMFTEDETLPQPGYVSISATGQDIDMQFGSTPDTFHAMAQWADKFGGTVTGSQAEDVHGESSVRCEVKFAYAGVQVKAYAYVHVTSTR